MGSNSFELDILLIDKIAFYECYCIAKHFKTVEMFLETWVFKGSKLFEDPMLDSLLVGTYSRAKAAHPGALWYICVGILVGFR